MQVHSTTTWQPIFTLYIVGLSPYLEPLSRPSLPLDCHCLYSVQEGKIRSCVVLSGRQRLDAGSEFSHLSILIAPTWGSLVLPYCKRWKAEQLAHDPILILQLDGTRLNTSPFFFCSVSLTRPTSCGTTSPRRGSSPSGLLEGRTLPIPTSSSSYPRSKITSMEWHSQVVAPNFHCPPA